MAGTGRVSVTKASPVGYNQYDVTVKFDIAFDWGGHNYNGAYFDIWCAGQYQTGTATFSVPSGGGSWVWTTLGSKTFRVTMPTSGSSYQVKIEGFTNTGVNPSTISATGYYTLPARTWLWTVSYNANGGTGAPGNQTKTYGQTLKLSTGKPTREGYTFLGWATSASSTTTNYAPGANYTSNAALTLYAVWKANTWTVKYDANGGTGAPGNQTKTYGQTLKLSTAKPIRTNYNFLGWGTSGASTTVAYASGADYTVNADVTLYAIWELAYLAPRITDVAVDRCDATGKLSEEGTYGKVIFNWATDKTVTGIHVEYKKSTDTGWTLASSPGGSGVTGSVDMVVGGASFDTEYEYDVKIVVEDELGSSDVIRSIAPMYYIIDFLKGGKGVAFGKPANEEDLVDSKWSIKTDTDFIDRFGTTVNNGLAKHSGSGSGKAIDPNTTIHELILTDINVPISSGLFYIQTLFHETKSMTANRTQYAVPYVNGGSMYHRVYSEGNWSQWRRHINADEMADYAVEQGTNSRGNYIKWSSGKLEMWGNVDFDNVNITNRPNTSTFVYNSVQYTIDFPLVSLTSAKVFLTNYSNTGAYVTGSTGGDNRKSKIMFWFYAPNNITNTGQHVNWYAIGTWK